MKLLSILTLVLPVLFVSCNDKDEPYEDLFSMSVELRGDWGEVQLIKHECEVTINGEQQYIHVFLLGNYNDLTLMEDSMRDWSVVTFSDKSISISVLENNTGTVRNDKIGFIVSKGSIKNVGTISVVQLPKEQEH